MEWVFLGAIVAVCLTTISVGKEIATQTAILQEGLLDIKKALQKEESTDYTSLMKYDANDIYNLLEDFPEKIAKEIKCELGYSRDELMGLAYDIRDIKGSLIDIEKELTDIRVRMPD